MPYNNIGKPDRMGLISLARKRRCLSYSVALLMAVQHIHDKRTTRLFKTCASSQELVSYLYFAGYQAELSVVTYSSKDKVFSIFSINIVSMMVESR